MRLYLYIIFLLFFFKGVVAQNTQSTNSTPPDTSFAVDDTSGGFGYFYSEEEESKYLNYKPILGLGSGVITYFGDVQDVYNSNPIVGLKALNFSVAKGLSSAFDIEFRVLSGNLTGNQNYKGQHLNFKTSFLSGGISLSYNFEHLLKKEGLLLSYKEYRKLIPYISLGLETFSFNSKADLKDANGYVYNYWSDGTIRNIPESPQNEEQSVVLTRDYVYETDLREMDNDGLGKYNLQAFAIPIDLAVELQLHERFQIRLGATYHYMLVDLIDDVSDAGEGARKGNSSGDSYLYTYFTLKFDIFSSVKEVEENVLQFDNNVDTRYMDDIVYADEDGDGVDDMADLCPGTPKGVSVDTSGCAFDDDYDGVPNYRDKELTTPKDSITDLDGVMLTPEMIAALSDTTDAIEYDQICDYYPSMCGMDLHRLSNEEIPAKFAFLDEDGDGYISIDEVSKAIDSFFDMKSDLTIDDIYELTDFFFSQ